MRFTEKIFRLWYSVDTVWEGMFSQRKSRLFHRAIAIRCAPKLPKNVLKALIVVDVVEGTAMAALPKMTMLLATRPKSFASVEDAITWAYVFPEEFLLI